MTPFDSPHGAQTAYDFWLGLIPQFLGQFGVPGAAATANTGESSAFPPPHGLMFPADQVAKAATMTQHSLQALAQSLAPILQAGGVPNLLAQWATATPALTSGKSVEPAAAAATATQAMLASWSALMSNAAGATPQMSTPAGQAPVFPLQAMTQAWVDMGSKLAGATPAQLDAAFDRTYGALSDAFGLGPARTLQSAWREAVAASIAQQDARANYASLVQSAFLQGFQRLLTTLAEKANAGERIDSVLALLRLWASNTEEVVHETLQSERGLAATAALTRSALAHRKKMQHVAAVYAGVLDMATRHDVDEAYREIQALKRELRGLRQVHGSPGVGSKRPTTSRPKNKRGKGSRMDNDQGGE